jgi:nitrogen regulatory protein PII 1
MKMIKAIVRPEKTEEVANALEKAGYDSLTRMHVFGRGKQKGLKVGDIVYDTLPKIFLLVVVNDSDVEEVSKIITDKARTGNIGDGKIFISEVEDVIRIRTGERGAGAV